MKLLFFGFILIYSVLFLPWNQVDAVTPGWSPPEDYRAEESLGGHLADSDDNDSKSAMNDELSMDDIFGSEQVFPFEPGLGN